MTEDTAVPVWFETLKPEHLQEYEASGEGNGFLSYFLQQERVATAVYPISKLKELETKGEVVQVEEFHTPLLNDFLALISLLKRLAKYELDHSSSAMLVKII